MTGSDHQKKSRRSITDQEIALIKAMLRRGIDKTTTQAYFTHPDRPVNYGRVTNIEQGSYGPEVIEASNAELDEYLENWRAKREINSGQLAEAIIDVSTLSPVHTKRLEMLFERDDGGRLALRSSETDDIENKKTFHRPGHEKLLRAVAALANNRGGYVLFGVEDQTDLFVGLQDNRFKSTDPSAFAMAFRDAMEPCPRFELGTAELAGTTLGAVYVHRETDGPIIATKDEHTFKAGVIYYRYPGESRAIAGADFRRLLAERDRRARLEAAEFAKRAAELGGDGALLNLIDGHMEGRSGSLLVGPELLDKIRFIKEGEFVQKGGEATLRLVGNIEVAPPPTNTLIRERIVRQGITDRDVLGTFLEQERVQYPAEYVLHSCHSNKRWLPIFYFARVAERPVAEIIELVKAEESGTVARGRLIDRLSGRATARTEPSAASRQVIAAIGGGTLSAATTLSDIRKQAIAIQGWSDANRPIGAPLAVLRTLRGKVKELSADVDRSTEIRRAAAWLDELYF